MLSAVADESRTPPTLPRLSSPLPTLFVWVSRSTSPSSTMKFWTHPTVLAILPSRPLTTPLPSSTHCLRSRTVIALSSCSCSATTSLSGPLLTPLSPKHPPKPLRRRRPRLRSPPRSPRLRSLPPLLLLKLAGPVRCSWLTTRRVDWSFCKWEAEFYAFSLGEEHRFLAPNNTQA